MKNKSLLVALMMIAGWQLLTSALRDPNNPPVARTGAPGETTCAASGCHSGGSFTGTVAISGVPDTVVPNQSYTVTLTHASNAVRSGFELTCLDGGNVKCGALTAGSGCSTGSNVSSGRQYVRQSTPKNLSGGSTSWTFTWKAPATAFNNAATFYFTSLAANGNGNNSGDNVLIGTKNVVFQTSVVATHESAQPGWLKLYPTVVNMELHLDLTDATAGTLRLYDQHGRLVLQTALTGSNNIVPVNTVPHGLYLAQITAGGRQSTQKLLVE